MLDGYSVHAYAAWTPLTLRDVNTFDKPMLQSASRSMQISKVTRYCHHTRPRLSSPLFYYHGLSLFIATFDRIDKWSIDHPWATRSPIRYESDSERLFIALNVNLYLCPVPRDAKTFQTERARKQAEPRNFCPLKRLGKSPHRAIRWNASIAKRHGNRVCVIRESGRRFLLFFPTMRSRQNPPIANSPLASPLR